jgi:hypothetical protein
VTGDLIEFLRARLDDTERVARAANPGPWEVGPKFGARDTRVYIRDEGDLVDTVGTLVFVSQVSNRPRCRENAQHIARHDPARVLREVDAKRRTLELHDSDGAHECPAGHDSPGDVYAGYERECLTLRLLALPYADHADYQPEWAP